MKCRHTACFKDGRRMTLPGTDTSCYATGDTVTTRWGVYKLGAAHKEHYGWADALEVSWDAEEVDAPAPYLTRARD